MCCLLDCGGFFYKDEFQFCCNSMSKGSNGCKQLFLKRETKGMTQGCHTDIEIKF